MSRQAQKDNHARMVTVGRELRHVLDRFGRVILTVALVLLMIPISDAISYATDEGHADDAALEATANEGESTDGTQESSDNSSSDATNDTEGTDPDTSGTDPADKTGTQGTDPAGNTGTQGTDPAATNGSGSQAGKTGGDKAGTDPSDPSAGSAAPDSSSSAPIQTQNVASVSGPTLTRGTERDGKVFSKDTVVYTVTVQADSDPTAEVAIGSSGSVAWSGGDGTWTATITYSSTTADTITVGTTENPTQYSSTSVDVAIDTEGPVVKTPTFSPTAVGSTPLGSDTVSYFNLDSSNLVATVSVSDPCLNTNTSVSYLKVEWLAADGTSTGQTENKTVDWTKNSAGDYTADFSFNANDFVVNDSLRIAKATVVVADVFDHAPAAETTMFFTAENALLKDNSISFSLTPGTDVKSFSEGGNEYFNGGVTCTVTDASSGVISQANSSAKLDGADQSLSWTSDNTADIAVAAPASSVYEHTVSITAKTAHGATREYTKSFTTDTTTPTATVSLSTPKKADGGVNFYDGTGFPASVTVEITDTSSFRSTNDIAITFSDGADDVIIPNSAISWDGYKATIANGSNESTKIFDDQKTYTLKSVTYKTKFDGSEDDPRPFSSLGPINSFVIDSINPQVTLNFSGPVVTKEINNKIRAFFGKYTEEETYNVGAVTIDIDDAALDLDTVGIFLDGIEQTVDKTQWTAQHASVTIPYYSSDSSVVSFGENNHKLVVKAQDQVGNYAGGSADGYKYAATYSQGGKDSKTIIEGVTGELDDQFTVDVTPVDLVVDTGLPLTANATVGDVNIYDKSSTTLTVCATDANFDVETSTVEIYSNKGASVATLSGDAWGSPDSSGKYTLTYEFSEDKGNEYSFKVNANDLAGNKTAKYDSYKELGEHYFSFDTEVPVVSATLVESPVISTVSKTDFFSSDVSVAISVDDPYFDTSSIIEYVDEHGYVQTSTSGWESKGGLYTCNLKLEGENQSSVVRSFTVKAKDILGHTAADYTYATMRTPEESVEPEATGFVIDKTPPDLDVEYDHTSVGSLKEGNNTDEEKNIVAYYDTDKLTAKIIAIDTNFNPNDSSINVTNGTIVQGWTLSDDSSDTWTAIVEFKENAASTKSKLEVNAVDYAGRNATFSSGDFVLDAHAPTIDVSFSASPIGTLGSINYYDEAPTATITVVDNNFEDDLSCSSINPVGSNSELKWVKEEEKAGTWKATIQFAENCVDTKELKSTLSTSVCDKVYSASKGSVSGHNTEWKYSDAYPGINDFIVDLTAPEVSVAFDQPINSSFDGKDFFGSAETLTATVTVKDYNFNESISPVTETSTTGTWSGSWQTSDNYTYTTTVTYAENSGTVNSLALDLIADNVYFVASSKSAVAGTHSTSYKYGAGYTKDSDGKAPAGTGFVLDLTAPVLSLAKESTGYSTRWGSESDPYLFYKTDGAGITVTMEDINGIRFAVAESPFALSGKGEDLGTSDTQSVALIEGSSVDERDANNNQMRLALVKLTDYAGNYSIWNISPDGTVHRVAYGSTSSGNSAVDLHDGSAVHPLYMVLDRVAPYLSWGAAPTAGAYYNTTQSATINIDELNFDLLQSLDGGRVIASVDKQECNAGRASSSWTVPASAFAGGGNSWSSRIDFTIEGHYSVYAQFDDIAGNTSNAISIGEFTLDWTAPVIQDITFDNNNARNGKYYKAGRTATITIIEHNWDPSLVTVNTNGSVSGWSDNGDTHTCTVSFLTDGDYKLSVSCTDKAGNAAESKSVPDFTVDLTNPTITFTEVAASTAYNGTIAPVINYADEKNFDANGMQYTLTGAKHGAQGFNASRGSSGNQGTVTFSDFPREVEADDIYTLTAHLTDLAGNEADGSIMFSVNRFGSNFIILNAQDYEDGYLAEPQEILVQEINVSGVQSEKHGVSVTHGLSTENLQANGYGTPDSDGYYIAAGSDGSGWSSYLYHVGSGNFKEDGNYHVVVNSTDTANNLNNSANYYDPEKHDSSDAEVSFILDTADPFIDGLNVSNGGLYDANNTVVGFNVVDNIGCKEVKVKLDGETYSSADSDLVNLEANGYCSVKVPAKFFAPRDMEIEAFDYAGRSDTANVRDFRVSDNFFELNLLLIIGLLVIAAAGTAGGIMYNKRRNQAQNQDKSNE